MARLIEWAPAGQILAAQFVHGKVWEHVPLKASNGSLKSVLYDRERIPVGHFEPRPTYTAPGGIRQPLVRLRCIRFGMRSLLGKSSAIFSARRPHPLQGWSICRGYAAAHLP